MIADVILFILTGLIAGVLAGLFGIGGGVVIVPMLAEIFQRLAFHESVIMHLAIGTSLCVMFFTASMSAFKHHRRGGVDWHIIRVLAPALLCGAFLGTQIGDIFNTALLQFCFSLFLIFTAVNILQTFRGERSYFQVDNPTKKHHLIAGGTIGILAGLLGIGGGVLTVPWLIQAGYHSRIAAGCSSACTLLIAVSGIIGTLIAGSNEPYLPAYSFSFIYLPAVLCVAIASMTAAPFGVYLSYKLPTRILGYLFSGLLVLVASRLAYISLH